VRTSKQQVKPTKHHVGQGLKVGSQLGPKAIGIEKDQVGSNRDKWAEW